VADAISRRDVARHLPIYRKTVSGNGVPTHEGIDQIIKSLQAAGQFTDRKVTFDEVADDRIAKEVAKELIQGAVKEDRRSRMEGENRGENGEWRIRIDGPVQRRYERTMNVGLTGAKKPLSIAPQRAKKALYDRTGSGTERTRVGKEEMNKPLELQSGRRDAPR
jgi:hypothetical protein